MRFLIVLLSCFTALLLSSCGADRDTVCLGAASLCMISPFDETGYGPFEGCDPAGTECPDGTFCMDLSAFDPTLPTPLEERLRQFEQRLAELEEGTLEDSRDASATGYDIYGFLRACPHERHRAR